MRKTLSLLLILVLFSVPGLSALAEVPNGGVVLDAVESIGTPRDDAVAVSGGLELSLPDNDEIKGGLDLSLSIDADALTADSTESVQPNASVPSKVTLGVGESYPLKVENAKKYQSSNAKVATVSSKGVVKGQAKGSATITITLKSGDALKVKITVKAAPSKVTLNKTKLTLEAGKTFQLKATLPAKSASKLTWSSNRKSVAKVSDDGLVTAVKAGTAVIKVMTFNGEKATCTVTVKKATPRVGVAFPTRDLYRWERDGANLTSLLEKAGYAVDMCYAQNDVATQLDQIKGMIDDDCDVLVVAPVEAYSLGEVLQQAIEKGIPVIAYDRLIMGSEDVSYYVTFGAYQIGVLQGKYIQNALKLKDAKGPFNIEFTAGDPGDRNAKGFYDGAMSVLKPYIKSGKLKVLSGQTRFTDVCTEGWITDNARKRAEKILSSKYADGVRLHAWLCSNDSTALGVIHALEAKYTGKWPVITGQDCDLENVKYIIKGKQAMSVFKDTTVLVKQVVKMVGQIVNHKAVSVNDKKTYDNGSKVVPAFLCTPIAVTKGNYRKVLIDSGIYPEDALKD